MKLLGFTIHEEDVRLITAFVAGMATVTVGVMAWKRDKCHRNGGK